ncbi:hypothetical protein [Caldalkalibacillus mannanilyticus]|uniref:hypothetical protein n=1 Tax=Caldalkalibacillus mannanilyticus TaxID=1418 RepID=UPI000469D644|nr:hypothetical protein [Caldalkalibacillus mannanilyticus]
MLTDINLLPQREKPSTAYMVILWLLIGIALFGSLYTGFQYYQLTKEKEMKKQQLELTIKLREAVQTKVDEGALSFGSAREYHELILGVEQLSLPSVTMIDELSAALPVKGFFKNYTFQDAGSIRLAVEFPTLEEAAGYLHQLIYMEWVEKAEMPTVIENCGCEKGNYLAEYDLTLNKASFEARKGAEK